MMSSLSAAALLREHVPRASPSNNGRPVEVARPAARSMLYCTLPHLHTSHHPTASRFPFPFSPFTTKTKSIGTTNSSHGAAGTSALRQEKRERGRGALQRGWTRGIDENSFVAIRCAARTRVNRVVPVAVSVSLWLIPA